MARLQINEIRRQKALRYVLPLREGGSLPALVDADDGFKYVVKFRGAGHGVKALIAELIGASVAKALGLDVPEMVFIDIDERFGITEPDEEIQDLLKASRGLNLGLHFLSGALTLDPYVNPVDGDVASKIVWLDAFLTNVDRTVSNTNMLVWHDREVWLIDHGASLVFHHNWSDVDVAACSPFKFIERHALLHKADRLDEADKLAHACLTDETLQEIVNLIPDEWLVWEGSDITPEQRRAGYLRFLTKRLENSEIFLKEAKDGRSRLFI